MTTSFNITNGQYSYDYVKVMNDSTAAIPITDSSSSLTVDGKAYRSSVSFLRPSNTTAYTAGDVVGAADGVTPANAGSAIHTFTGVGPSNGFIILQSLDLIITNSSVPSGMGSFRLHLYTSSPAAILDNAVMDIGTGEITSYVGYVELPTPQDMGSILYSQADYSGRLLRLGTASTSLFGELETRGGYTPASGTTYQIRMRTLEAGL